MVNDLTVLYYTANKISDQFAGAVRTHLRQATAGRPIVSVSQAPIDLGINICVGNIGASIYNVYRQILIGAKAAETPYVACVEDDSLYVPEHFDHRPAPGYFVYNRHRWVVTPLPRYGGALDCRFYYRERTQMAMCIAWRDLLIETLEERFARYPEPVAHDVAKRTGWGEPGRYEKNLGLRHRDLAFFRTLVPTLTFNHKLGLMGRRAVHPTDVMAEDLPEWGNATALWEAVHG